MTMWKSEEKTFLLILISLGLISPSLPLFCSKNCSSIQVRSSAPFIEPSARASCRNDSSTSICKGRIIAYYNGGSYPSYINYTLGATGDLAEREYENRFDTHGLANFTKYQVIINAKTEETSIIADFYCNTAAECALAEIKSLFGKYRRQANPLYPLKPLIYANGRSSELFCYDMVAERSEPCEPTSDGSPTCTSYSKQLRQECLAGTQIRAHVEFTLSSPNSIEFNTTNEEVECNVDNCNHVKMLAKIREITQDYAYGIAPTTINRAQRRGTMTNLLSVCFVALVLLV